MDPELWGRILPVLLLVCSQRASGRVWGRQGMVQGVCSASPAPGAVPAPGMPGLCLEPCVSPEAGAGCRKWGRHVVHCSVGAAGACSMGCSFTPLFRALRPRCDLFKAQSKCLPVFTALGFRERTVNPSTAQAHVGELSRARAACGDFTSWS